MNTNVAPELIIFSITISIFLLLIYIIIRCFLNLAKVFGIRHYTLSFVLMAFATSIPELIVGLVSSVKGVGEIGIGVIFGSTIVNLTLITGLITILSKNLDVKNIYRRKEAILLAFITGFSILTILDGKLDRLDGFILLLAYFIYLYELWFSQAKNLNKKLKIHYTKFLPAAAIISIAITTLIFVSDILINSTFNISVKLGIFPLITGTLLISTIVAVPELLFEYKTINQKKERVSLGNLMGAIGTNMSLVLGLMAIINPITIIITPPFFVILFFSAFSILLFIIFLFTKQKLQSWEGIILIITFLVFLITLFISTLS